MTKELKIKSNPKKRAFKINWFTDEELVKYKLIDSKTQLIKPTGDTIDSLYKNVRNFLLTQGFVFGDFEGCRLIYNRADRLIEYGMEYKHIN